MHLADRVVADGDVVVPVVGLARVGGRLDPRVAAAGRGILQLYRERLPELLNVFYYRETLFIVYELLRDNLYHIYKYIEECKLPQYFTVDRLRMVAKQCLLTLEALHRFDVIHCDLKPENILICSLATCKIKVIDYGNAYLHHDQRDRKSVV